MRLVIDGRRLTPERTGVGRYLESLVEEWSQTGLPLAETVIVLKDRRGAERVPQVPGLRVEVIGERLPGLLWEEWGLGRILRPTDLLFAPANLTPPSWRGRTVVVVHDAIQAVMPDSFPWHVRWRFGWRYRRAAERADRILVPSHATARDVARVYAISLDRIRVIHPGPGTEFRPLTPESDLVRDARRAVGLGGARFFVFVGKRTRRRNIPALLDAWKEHLCRHPTHWLVLVGPAGRDDEPLLREREPGIALAGHVPEPILRGLLASAIALLYPSNYEGFGLPIVEAMACGCPVITLRNSALTEVGGDAALYLDSPDPQALAAAMDRLATDAAFRSQLAQRGFAHAARFSRARFADAVKSELVAVASSVRPSTRAGMRVRDRLASAAR